MSNLTGQEICASHLDYAGEVCSGCGEKIDEFGNTESCFKYCCFPNCGCDGERLCMAGESNEFARRANGEGMWRGGAKNLKYIGELFDGLRKKERM